MTDELEAALIAKDTGQCIPLEGIEISGGSYMNRVSLACGLIALALALLKPWNRGARMEIIVNDSEPLLRK